jgi:TolB-like protein
MRNLGIAVAAALFATVSAKADSMMAGSVAVLPFVEAGTNQLWVGESIAEALRQTFAQRGLPTMNRDDVTAALADLRLRGNVPMTLASAVKVGQTLNTNRLVFGSYTVQGGVIAITAYVSDHMNARVVGPIRESAPLAELDRVEAHLAWELLNRIQASLAGPEVAYRGLRPAVRTSAEENFIRGWTGAEKDRERYYQQAAREDAKFARPVLELGMLELRRRNFKAAADWLVSIDAGDPLFASAYFYLGVARFELADYAGAQAVFERIKGVLPIPEVVTNIAVCESRRNSLHALASFREALDMDPSQADYHFNMGFILFKTGQFEAAADRFRAVLERDPSDSIATTLLGRAIKGDGLRKSADDARVSTAERFRASYDEPMRPNSAH